MTEGDEVELAGPSASGIDPGEIQPRFRNLATQPLEAGEFTAVVESVHPAALLDPAAGSACHVWARHGQGDLVVLRVYGAAGPVVEDARFGEMRAIVEGALQP